MLRKIIFFKSSFLILVISILLMAGCKGVMNNNHEDISADFKAEQTLMAENSPIPSISQINKEPSVAKVSPTEEQPLEPYVTGLQLEGEKPMEPNVNNGASYIKNYRGTLFFADNNYLWTLRPQKGRIPNVLEPICFDIYKDVLYYIKEDSNVLYAVDLDDFSAREVLNDVFPVPSAHSMTLGAC